MTMKSQLIIFLLLLFFAFSVSAQNKEARPIDGFGEIACGAFQMRMGSILAELQNSPDSKIYVLYFGGRYRREYSQWNQKLRKYDKLTLKYPHPDDGLNWAKAIPLFFENYTPLKEHRDFVRDKIILINGGYREERQVEIWLVSKDGKLPEPIPSIDEKSIKFKAKKPYRIPNFACCYGDCEQL